VEHRRVP